MLSVWYGWLFVACMVFTPSFAARKQKTPFARTLKGELHVIILEKRFSELKDGVLVLNHMLLPIMIS